MKMLWDMRKAIIADGRMLSFEEVEIFKIEVESDS